MQRKPQILIHQLNYSLPNGKVVFHNLDLSITERTTGLVGKNGIGKTTLLNLITGEIKPASGSITTVGKVAYLPQNYAFPAHINISEALGIQEKLSAMQRILNGSSAENDFVIFNEDWTLQERTQQNLQAFGLSHLELNRSIGSLSGGEITRLMLMKTFTSAANILLLDEPTNNLDAAARKLVYENIQTWQGIILVVTHDRTLLNQLEQIIELTILGAQVYGGNYQAYLAQKALETAAKYQQLRDAEKFMEQTQKSMQASREKHDQNRAKGRKQRITGKIDKLSANAAQGRSERNQRRMATKEERMLIAAQSQVKAAKEKVEILDEINIDLPKTNVPNGKLILKIENLTFAYPAQTQSLIKDFSLIITGPERIAITGNNGSGKTTLIKLILGKLQPSSGKISLSVERVSYLDQQAQLLAPKLTLLENFMQINPTVKEQEARSYLAQFLFKNVDALKLVETLSGGEKLRALLACVLMSNQPPQLLILDEPTNHLDLTSIASIESALNCYQGALLVISHDQTFLENIGVQRILKAPF